MLGVPTRSRWTTTTAIRHQPVLRGVRAGRLAGVQPHHVEPRRALEYEGGFVEPTTAAIGEFDFDAELPISEAAEQAYLRNPIAGLPSIDVRGGNLYPGSNGAPGALNKGSTLMPRLGVVCKLNEKTVVRGGYGLFYDTNNVLNAGIDQFGFSRGTGTVITNDTG